jgi:hypothetical protein
MVREGEEKRVPPLLRGVPFGTEGVEGDHVD